MPDPILSLLVAAGAASVLLGSCFLILLRHVGSIEQRMEIAGLNTVTGGPPLGRLGTVVRIRDLAGRSVELGTESDRPVTVVFISENCSRCASLLSRLAKTDASKPLLDELVLVSNLAPDDLAKYVEKAGVRGVRVSSSPELMRGWDVQRIPYAVVLDRVGTVVKKGILEEPDNLWDFVGAEARSTESMQAQTVG